ncbi:hypothetical protein P5P86_10990 [Nocardioides sp. BP30]|uniref:hypothetical protein n=1 Tax=Nocardioides sp. BP30 TaxID=3036374 RepID=UPI0024682A4E|nr:hypothetical protein [Nocardioides sp. BP30]WGL50492.1 hypothetical protein P5P86_10990 [Nocardioides sp. BP30]
MDDIAWGALALALTLVAGCVTWMRAKQAGPAAAVRWAGITLLPLAAYFTHTLRLIGRIGTAVSDWAVGFVWNPAVWLGLVMAVIGFVLIAVSTRISGRSGGDGQDPTAGRAIAPTASRTKRRGTAPAGADLGLGEDLGDIQAILKKHGIS